MDFISLEQKIKDHFIAYFKLLGKTKILINIFDNTDLKFTINSLYIPDFMTKKFKILKHVFQLDYVVNDDSVKNYDGFYCAAGRVVIKNSYLDSRKKLKTFNDINILYLLSSEYFNINVNDERDDFNIKPLQVNQDLYGNVSWKDIQDELSKLIKEIAKENNIDIEKIAKDNLNKSIDEAPFLANYLINNDYDLSSDDLISNAKKEIELDKDYLRNEKNSKELDYKLVLGKVTQSELAEYMFDRQKIIDNLKKLTTDKALEKEIHNLFMPQRTVDNNIDYRSNNLWLFDDRFMSYDKIFSEIQIKEIFPELHGILKRPDILSIVSNTYSVPDKIAIARNLLEVWIEEK